MSGVHIHMCLFIWALYDTLYICIGKPYTYEYEPYMTPYTYVYNVVSYRAHIHMYRVSYRAHMKWHKIKWYYIKWYYSSLLSYRARMKGQKQIWHYISLLSYRAHMDFVFVTTIHYFTHECVNAHSYIGRIYKQIGCHIGFIWKGKKSYEQTNRVSYRVHMKRKKIIWHYIILHMNVLLHIYYRVHIHTNRVSYRAHIQSVLQLFYHNVLRNDFDLIHV